VIRRALLVLLACAACSRGDDAARSRVFAPEEGRAQAAPTFDPSRPLDALALDADDAARRLGSFEWAAAVEWTVARNGDDAQRVRVAERHRLLQAASGEFEVEAENDPGFGPGSETGKHVVYAGGTTYARALPAAFRERPTDRGRDARRFREESFGAGRSLVALFGPSLRVEPAGEATLLGRRAHRYRLSLAKGERAAAVPAAAAPPGSTDPDTARRQAFLAGRDPASAEGELIVDAATGVPLRLRLAGAFTVRDAEGVTADVELLAQVKALGSQVGAVVAPEHPRPDERKPAGPSTALEAAGLKRRGDEKPAEKAGAGAEPADEPE
jgi:hypothetical protein